VSGATSAGGSGAVFGVVVVFLLQQLGYISLSGLEWGIIYLLIGLIVGGILGGLIGWALTRHH
jgi:ABC-type thiamin/hydroxymethylpyrimidine transport system permease subunit